MTMSPFNFSTVHPSWQECLDQGLSLIDRAYLQELEHSSAWLPGKHAIFSAFSLPMEKVNYVLFGESPYPRRESANGYAFWDAAVQDLWSDTGLSKKVNRATSMRNILKMLLLADGHLTQDNQTQAAIAQIDKTHLIQTNTEFFTNLLNHGFLLLNATPVLRDNGTPHKDARFWQPFIHRLLDGLLKVRPQVKLILLGRIAHQLDQFITCHPQVATLSAEHPYNLSFITNPAIQNFFRPLNLLKR